MSQLYPPEFDGGKAPAPGPARPFLPPLGALFVLHMIGWVAVFNLPRGPDLRMAGLVVAVVSGATSLVILVATVPGPGRIIASLAVLGLVSLLVGSMTPYAAGGMLAGAIGVTFFGGVAMLPVWLLQLIFGWELRWREPQDDEENPSASPQGERQFQLWHLFVGVAIVALICAVLRMAFGQQLLGGIGQTLAFLAPAGVLMIPSILLSVSILRVREAWAWSLLSIVVLLPLGYFILIVVLGHFAGTQSFEWKPAATFAALVAATSVSLWLLRAGGVVYGPRGMS